MGKGTSVGEAVHQPAEIPLVAAQLAMASVAYSNMAECAGPAIFKICSIASLAGKRAIPVASAVHRLVLLEAIEMRVGEWLRLDNAVFGQV